MKLIHVFFMVLVMFLGTGCPHRNTVCAPPAVFSTLVILPFDGSSTYVEEAKYERLPRGIATETTTQLMEQLEDSKMFNKIIKSAKCSGKAVKIEGKITRLTHSKGKFTVQARGKFTNCQTNEIIAKYENSNRDSNSENLSSKIAEEVAEDFKKTMCEKL